ncbi:hypothetical protein BSKO_11630 [Bryopsis sp. KO-2023]|nr:hypothetical protein BSKO_11630 [Bryopsis sp. KO-2023]
MTETGEISQAVQGGLEAEMADDEGLNDEGYEEEDDDYEEGDEEDQPGDALPPAAEQDRMVPDWTSLKKHPEATSSRIVDAFKDLSSRGRSRLSVLMVGRPGVGKSHTTNSLFAAQVTQVVPFHMVTYTNAQPVVVRKKSGGVTFTVIDTPGLVEQDGVSEVNLRRVAFQTRNNPVDVVVYVDRIDMMSDELDLQVLEGLNRTFGPDVWKRMIIGLTRSDVRAPPPGLTYADVVNRRVEDIRAAMRKVGAKDCALPFALFENSVRCRLNDAGEKVVDGHSWVPAFFENAVEVALGNPTAGLRYEPGAVEKQKNLLQKFVLIPLAIAAQVLIKVFVIDRIIEEDGTKGDQYGPFDPATVEYEQQKLKERRERDRQERAEARQKAGKLKDQSRQRIEGTVGLEDSSDEDDFFDDE